MVPLEARDQVQTANPPPLLMVMTKVLCYLLDIRGQILNANPLPLLMGIYEKRCSVAFELSTQMWIANPPPLQWHENKPLGPFGCHLPEYELASLPLPNEHEDSHLGPFRIIGP